MSNLKIKTEINKLVNNLTIDQIDIVDILNKNWPQVSLFVYPDNANEEEGSKTDIDKWYLEHMRVE